MNKAKKINPFNAIIYILVGIFSLACLYPFLMVISGSLSTQSDLINYGYRLIPKQVTTGAYKVLFENGSKIVNAYKVTIIVTVFGTFFSLLINSAIAFAISRKDLKYKTLINVIVLIPMLFTGGMVPWYIVCINVLHLKNTYLALIVPSLANCWNIFLFRNYFYSVPNELYEAAKMDGSSDYRIYYMFVRLSAPVIATLGLFTSLGYWNDWWLGLMLTDDTKMQPLQLLLRSIISNLQMVTSTNPTPELLQLMMQIPADSIKMAMVIITIGPIVLIYPFVQRFFVKGIMVGAVKG